MIKWLQGREQTYVFLPFTEVEGKWVKIKNKIRRPFPLNNYLFDVLREEYSNFVIMDSIGNGWLINGSKWEMRRNGNSGEGATPPLTNPFDVLKYAKALDLFAYHLSKSLEKYLEEKRGDNEIKIFPFLISADENYSFPQDLSKDDGGFGLNLRLIGQDIARLFKPCECRHDIRGWKRLHITYQNPPTSDLGRISTHLIISACFVNDDLRKMVKRKYVSIKELIDYMYEMDVFDRREMKIIEKIKEIQENKTIPEESIDKKEELEYTIYTSDLSDPFDVQKYFIQSIESDRGKKEIVKEALKFDKSRVEALLRNWDMVRKLYMERKDDNFKGLPYSNIIKHLSRKFLILDDLLRIVEGVRDIYDDKGEVIRVYIRWAYSLRELYKKADKWEKKRILADVVKRFLNLDEFHGVDVNIQEEELLESVSLEDDSIFEKEEIEDALFIPPTLSSWIRVLILDYFKRNGYPIETSWNFVQANDGIYKKVVKIPLELKVGEEKYPPLIDLIHNLFRSHSELEKYGIKVEIEER